VGPRAKAAALVLASLVLLAGCGDDSDDDAESPTPLRRAETAHPLPKLPAGWKPEANRAGGFAFGLPRGWKAESSGITSLVRSFDRLVAVSIAPDRTSEAIETPLEDFATRALAALPGFEGEVEAGSPRPFDHRYRAVRIEASGTAAESGLRQRIRIIVLRRDRQATFAVVIAANADPRTRASERVAERLVETLRSRPVSLAPRP
jgi:hypothetical protein